MMNEIDPKSDFAAEDCLNLAGFQNLLIKMAEPFLQKIRLSSPVKSVDYSKDIIKITTSNGDIIEAEKVVMYGVLHQLPLGLHATNAQASLAFSLFRTTGPFPTTCSSKEALSLHLSFPPCSLCLLPSLVLSVAIYRWEFGSLHKRPTHVIGECY
jgi:hypothetical protein